MMLLCRFYRSLFLVTCLIISVSRCTAYYGSSSNSIRDKLETVDDKIDILTNEVSRLADATSAFTNSEKPPMDPVTLIAINRSPTSDGNVFTIHYKKNEDEVYTDIIIDEYRSYRLRPDSQDEGPDEGCSITFTCNQKCKHAQAVNVVFTNTSESSSIKLVLDNTETRARFQDQFTVPTLEILHSGDLAYDNGSDVQVKISSSYGGKDDHRYTSVSSSLRVVNLDTDSFMDRVGEEWIRQTDEKRFLETEETTLIVQTSDHSVSGLLDMTLTFTDSGEPLLKSVEVLRSVVLRPRDQDGPFPAGFVEFKHDQDYNLHGGISKVCKVGTSCLYACSALGTSITALEIRLKDESNQTVPVATTYDSESTFDYSRTVEWTVEPTTDSEDMTFQCVARTAIRNLTRELQVIAQSDQLYIDRNNSFIEIENDEANPGYGNLTLTCSVVGRPVWDVSFQVSYGLDMFYPINLRLEISRDGGYTVATATMNFNPIWNSIDGITAFKCIAEGYGQGVDYILDMPPIPSPAVEV